jgi:toxin ParE1/3/4
MSLVVFSTDAEEDLGDIADFIARDKPQVAHEWVSAMRERCELLAKHPLTGEVRNGFGVPGCRSIAVGHYVVFFRPTAVGVEIARIIHGSRDFGTV